jgi:hypothetical protein
MKKAIGLICMGLTLSTLGFAKDNATRTETRKCDAAFSLCETVAADDKNNCEKTAPSNCGNNYKEDISQCSNDKNDCLDKVPTSPHKPKFYHPPSTTNQN